MNKTIKQGFICIILLINCISIFSQSSKISEDEKIKTLFTPTINEVFKILFKKFKDIINISNSDLETFCKDFEFELNNKNISLKEQLKEINKKYNK